MSEPLVIVVDDDASVRRALERLLRTAALAVEAYASADALLAAELPDRPTCLILDVRMPGCDGFAVQDHFVRAGRDVAIVFLTGHGDVPSSVRAFKAGAVDFLEKPFAPEDLLAAVERALDVDRRRRAARGERDALATCLSELTPREREVMALVAAGMPNKLVADRLAITEQTVKVHRGRVMTKMRAPSLADLVRMADKLGLSL